MALMLLVNVALCASVVFTASLLTRNSGRGAVGIPPTASSHGAAGFQAADTLGSALEAAKAAGADYHHPGGSMLTGLAAGGDGSDGLTDGSSSSSSAVAPSPPPNLLHYFGHNIAQVAALFAALAVFSVMAPEDADLQSPACRKVKLVSCLA